MISHCRVLHTTVLVAAIVRKNNGGARLRLDERLMTRFSPHIRSVTSYLRNSTNKRRHNSPKTLVLVVRLGLADGSLDEAWGKEETFPMHRLTTSVTFMSLERQREARQTTSSG